MYLQYISIASCSFSHPFFSKFPFFGLGVPFFYYLCIVPLEAPPDLDVEPLDRFQGVGDLCKNGVAGGVGGEGGKRGLPKQHWNH